MASTDDNLKTEDKTCNDSAEADKSFNKPSSKFFDRNVSVRKTVRLKKKKKIRVTDTTDSTDDDDNDDVSSKTKVHSIVIVGDDKASKPTTNEKIQVVRIGCSTLDVSCSQLDMVRDDLAKIHDHI